MKLVGSKQRLCLSGWVLAALLMIFVNWVNYASMESTELKGYSGTIKALRHKLNRLETIMAEGKFDLPSFKGHQGFFARYQKTEPEADSKLPVLDGDVLQSEKPAPPQLPALTGIIQVLDHHGNISCRAVIDGKVYREKDRFKGFAIAKVTEKGIVLNHSGQRHFIESPKIYYSNDQGM